MAFFSKKADKKEEKKAEAAVQPASQEFAFSLPSLLIQPRISEKASHLAHLNKYVFMVKRKTNKVEVKKAVEAEYKVKVVKVNMINVQGKVKHFGRTAGKAADFKKAMVTLKKGDSIKGLTDVA